jgi:hypothetical protein
VKRHCKGNPSLSLARSKPLIWDRLRSSTRIDTNMQSIQVLLTGNGQVRQQSNTGGEVLMIKVIVFLNASRPDLTREQFSQYWKEKHAPLVMGLDVFKRMYAGSYSA